uniref:Cyclin-dependent kinase inhibitor domain-containing protein n=1 Tax=Amphiprion percula TaxID=161767 RepID=A0A3P8RJA6_AMPPE
MPNFGQLLQLFGPILSNSVRRSLFGPVDHEQLRRDLKLKLQQIMEQDTRRWNFNFEAETPLPGRFQWDEIPVQCAAPFYAQRNDAASKPEHGDQPSEEQSARTDQENRPSVSNTHKSPAEVTPVRRKRTHSRAAAKPRNNARITGKTQRVAASRRILMERHENK